MVSAWAFNPRTGLSTQEPHTQGCMSTMRAGLGTVWICVVMAACAPAASQPTLGASSTTSISAATNSSEQVTSSTSADTTTDPSVGSLLVLGDWGSGTGDQEAVAGAMARYAEENGVAAILTTGDNFYSDNAELLLAPLEWAYKGAIPIWISWGNHDMESARRREVVEAAFRSPPHWTVHPWGQIEIVILDSNQVESAEQLDFLARTLEDSQRSTVVVFHHPPLSCSQNGDTQTVLDSWVPRFDDDVVLVLSGHDHNYQRFEDDGVTYVVSGGGGQLLHKLTTCPDGHPQRLAGEAIHHFLVLEQSEEAITVEVVDVTDGVIDQFEVPLP